MVNSRIKKLSPLLINQLSAGEVVTRPASVIKELLENAIDAHANDIGIYIKQGGMELIEIVDNGNGIYPDDMVMAITRHATSKVADIEQLHGIETLGFRGEALASISAVSRLTLTSCTDNSGVGRQLSVAGTIDNPHITPIVCQQGTRVSVQDLYFNVPARRGNLKSITTEYSHIETVVRQIALAYSNISISLYHDGKCRLQLSANVSDTDTIHQLSLERLQRAFNKPLPELYYPIHVDLSVLCRAEDQQHKDHAPQINGWVWRSHDGDEGLLPRLIYINNRLVKSTHIEQPIRQTLQTLNIAHQHVGYALFFSLPHHWLNLNVHPTKQRINIYTLANIKVHLQQAMRSLLAQTTNTAQPVHYPSKVKSSSTHHVARPQAVYQVTKIDDNAHRDNDSSDNNQPKQTNGAVSPALAIADNSTTSVKHYRLRIITSNQNSLLKAQRLARLICHTLDIDEMQDTTTVTPYHKLDNAYCINIDIAININTEQPNSIADIIELTDRIARPWEVKYQRDINEVSLIFHQHEHSQYTQPAFNVIEWASCELL